jgi:2-iminobutanoate/2-iminopropanoate deaminase
MTVTKTKITPSNFTPTMGAYSHGYSVDIGDARMVFVTGQIALDENGALVSEDVAEQTRYVFDRIEKILNEAGSSLDDAVKAQVFVTNISDFSIISPVRNEFFAKSEPVSTLVEVNALVHPGCKVEIEVVAISALS